MPDSSETKSRWGGSARQFQHHIPQLLLNEWVDTKGRVIRFYEPRPGKFVASPAAVKSTAGQDNTYTANTLLRAARDFDDFDENGRAKIQQSHILEFVLSQNIDSQYTKAALDHFIRAPEAITTEDRDQLISLIMSFRIRHPAFMAKLEAKHKDAIAAKYDEFSSIVGTSSLSELFANQDSANRYLRLLKERDTVRELNPHLYEAMDIMADRARRDYLRTLKFGTVRLHGPRRAIISDVPVYEAEGLIDPFELFMPLSPEHLLFLFHPDREQEFSDFVAYGNLIETVNVKMACQSVDAVYATNRDELELVKTFFAAKYKEGPLSKILTGVR